MTEIRYISNPELKRPAMVMAFNGWADAGEVSTGGFDYLKGLLHPRILAEFSREDFYAFTEERPHGRIVNGFVEDYRFPTNRFYYAKRLPGQPDLIMFKAPEPQFNHDRFCSLVLEIASKFDVWAIFTLGGTYDYVPHWTKARVSAVYSDKKALEAAAPAEDLLNPGEYEGPLSIHTSLMVKAKDAGLPVIGLWGHAPIYVQTGNIKVHLAMVNALDRILGYNLDHGDMDGAVAEMDRRIDEMVRDNPSLQKYLDEIREEYLLSEDGKESGRPGTSSGEKGKIINFEDFLKKD